MICSITVYLDIPNVRIGRFLLLRTGPIIKNNSFIKNQIMRSIYLKRSFTGIIIALAASSLFTACVKSSVEPNTNQNPVLKVSTLAGGGVGTSTPDPIFGSAGAVNGKGTVASFKGPADITVDPAGIIYVADAGNNLIRKITADGTVTTFAGSGTAGSANGSGIAASFSGPQGITVDATGAVYVADSGNHLIRKISKEGAVTTFAGSGTAGSTNGNGIAASFNLPTGITVDGNGYVYVGDSGNNLIRRITPEGLVSTFAGTGASGSADGGPATATFSAIRRLAIDRNSFVYITDGNKIRKLSLTGSVTTLAGSTASGATNANGSLASFNAPYGIAVDYNGYVYVGDSGNAKVRYISPAGDVANLAGSGTSGATNGKAAEASFTSVRGLALDPTGGTLYAADYFNSLIRKIQNE